MRDTDTYRGKNADPTSQTPLNDESSKHEKKVVACQNIFVLEIAPQCLKLTIVYNCIF